MRLGRARCQVFQRLQEPGSAEEQAISDYLLKNGAALDCYALAGLIQACARLGSISAGRRIQALITTRGLAGNKSLGNHLINMYAKLGSLPDAAAAFESIAERNVVSYNAMITAFTQNGQNTAALNLFRSMLLLDHGMPNSISFVAAVKSCSGDLQSGRWIHDLVAAAGFSRNLIVATALVNMYAGCGRFEEARSVFDAMDDRNEITWSALIAARASAPGKSAEAWEIFEKMKRCGVAPNEVTFISLLSACGSPADLDIGEKIHRSALELGFASDAPVANAILNMYGKCGAIGAAREIFESMLRKSESQVAWNALIGACTQQNLHSEAIQLLREMQLEGVRFNKMTFLAALNACAGIADWSRSGKQIFACLLESGMLESSDDLVKTAVISLLGKCGFLSSAREIFDAIQSPDLISFSSLVTVHSGAEQQQMILLQRIQAEGIRPDSVIFTSAINTCSGLKLGLHIHDLIAESGVESGELLTALIQMYSRCGDVQRAKALFDSIPFELVDPITWNSIIGAYVLHHRPVEAMNLFRSMQQGGTRPVKSVLLTALHAAAASGFANSGARVHDLVVESRLELDSVVGTALIHMLVKCERLESARALFDRMEYRNVVTWNSILSSPREEPASDQQQLFWRFLLDGVKPDRVTFLTVLSSCDSLPHGKKLHGLVSECPSLENDTGVLNALVTMYSRCGGLEVSISLVDKMERFGDLITWNSMVAAYAQHGLVDKAVGVTRLMEQRGFSADLITLTVVLSACSHAGMVVEGCEFYRLMVGECGIRATSDHYCSVVDLLCRAGMLGDAEDLIRWMPVGAKSVSWSTLLGGCRIEGDVSRGRRAARRLLEMNPGSHGAYVMLAETYCG